MIVVRQVEAMRSLVATWRRADESVALVPTMGNLHDGHLALVKHAREHADRTVVSIFVNPTQFAPSEDFSTYPRTFEADCQKLEAANVSVVFAPDTEAIYPYGENRTWVEVTGLQDHLCGQGRPHHFRGVATVVSKLFHVVWPDVAVFGEKDYQQLTIIRRMTAELLFPIQILGVPTHREADGLAMSSRNHYLTADERVLAPTLWDVLLNARKAIEHGEHDYRALEARMAATLDQAGFQTSYFSVVHAETLVPAQKTDTRLVVAAAAVLGKARLIDNVKVTLDR